MGGFQEAEVSAPYWTYSKSEHLYALLNNCVVPQAPSRFSYWANGILSKFETLSVADKRLEDHDQALDAAVEEYRRIVKAGHWNWSNFE